MIYIISLFHGVDEFLERYEVLISERFKSKTVKQPSIGTIGVKLESGLLNINLDDLNIDLKEIEDILNSYKLKVKYHKLKDGSFLSLNKNTDMDMLSELTETLDISSKNIVDGNLQIPVYKSLYLDKLLKENKQLNVIKNDNFKNLVNDIQNSNDFSIKLPKKLNATLRDYQETGVKWLSVLDNYSFGGILADDMGLGKTLQVISILSSYIENNKKCKTSIVVCPSSLILNWENEIAKFAPHLKVSVLFGNASHREDIINNLENYNVIITSYDVLKRDIDCYINKKYSFKYIIADEAQYIKNSNTQNAKALKLLRGDIRFALTGTPIENSLAELWSIFDYVLPNYLGTYGKFKKTYEAPITTHGDSIATSRLKKLVSPFILRRLKKDVLAELPDKIITVYENQMDTKQENLYKAQLALAKEEISSELSTSTFEKSQIKILAAINRLRQVCCHPSLFIENYDGESSKLNQCMEIIKDAVKAGHKLLLFSSYTSMFEIIEKELKSLNINYFELTGKTKVTNRITMVDEFNKNPDIPVFLISLKAGGTGLNLTGADIVIHYDPWWNLSAENQATDRAYRIGQKNNVQVYKLITNNTIEEKIFELQEKKAALVDKMITSEETFINKLSKDDIMSLFE